MTEQKARYAGTIPDLALQPPTHTIVLEWTTTLLNVMLELDQCLQSGDMTPADLEQLERLGQAAAALRSASQENTR